VISALRSRDDQANYQLDACDHAVAAAAQGNKPFVEARGSVKPVPLPPGGPAPRMSDGHVDLSGVWFSGPTGKANAWSVVPDEPLKEDPVPFQPAAAAKIKAMTRTERELNSPGVRCTPVGTPGMWTINPYPHQVTHPAVRSPDQSDAPGMSSLTAGLKGKEISSRCTAAMKAAREGHARHRFYPPRRTDVDQLSGWFHSDQGARGERPGSRHELPQCPVNRGSKCDQAVDIGVANHSARKT
jgi:hypothetical protein